MPVSENTIFAGSVPENYDRYLGPMLFEPFALDLKERLKHRQLLQVLELACGTGRVTRHLAELMGEGHLTATDLNPDMLEVAKARVEIKNIDWQVVDAQQLPYPDASFDHIVCQFGVMFFPDKRSAFKEACRVLKQGGMFLFNTWDMLEHNIHSLLVQNALRKLLGDKAPDFLEKGPFSFFHVQQIRELILEAGFSSVDITIVTKEAYYEHNDDLMKGLMEGSPLANFINKLEPSQQQKAKEEVEKEIIATFGADNHHFSMQALVCTAIK